ncbi:class I SAM-dependent methyltransferase [Patescibacteria group bacterium]|nr:class I SAM-dependent methyltransferase [Patescibacteria group bacterium]MBU2025842.1 class I SAM-dependent methyltransferase [Patescibacteria group bacterium]
MSFEKPSTPNPEKELSQEQIKLIENIPVDSQDKVELLLTKLGIKKATEFILYGQTWMPQEGEQAKEIDKDKIQIIKQTLDRLGLESQFQEPAIENTPTYIVEKLEEDYTEQDEILKQRQRIDIYIAHNKESFQKYLKAKQENLDQDFGELYAFPGTAIKAFTKGQDNVLNREDLPEHLKEQDWSHFLTFKLSKNNWENEIQEVKKWADTVKKYSPKLYNEFIEDKKFDYNQWLEEQVLLPKHQRDNRFNEIIKDKVWEIQKREQQGEISEQEKIQRTMGRYFKGLELDRELLKGKKILDLGCDTGEFVRGCLEKGITKEIYGVDHELREQARAQEYEDHFFQADFEKELPVKDCDCIFSYAAISLNFDHQVKTIKALSSAVDALNENGEIKIYPVGKTSQDSDLEGIKEAEQTLNKVLAQLKQEKNIEWELKPIDINVSGKNEDVWLEQLLIIRKQKT